MKEEQESCRSRSISWNIDGIYIGAWSSGIPARSGFGHFWSDHWQPLKIVSTVHVAKYRRVARRLLRADE